MKLLSLGLFCYFLFISSHLSNAQKSFTFEVDDVEIPILPPSDMTTAESIMRNYFRIQGNFEDFSHGTSDDANFIGGLPGFVQAVHTAYQSHYPLKLSASGFIILIGQGPSQHINENADTLRFIFFNHKGKEKIKISRDGFILGQKNDWSNVFGELADEIEKRTKADLYDIVIDDTSIATKTSRIVSKITLMGTMKNYFSFDSWTTCGIPKITLEGSDEDWEKLRKKVQKIKDLNAD